MQECIFVTYQDAIGVVTVATDKSGVSFRDGKAYFENTETGKDIVIPANQILEINCIDW